MKQHFQQAARQKRKCSIRRVVYAFFSPPLAARLSFNISGPEREDMGNTIPYFPHGPPYPTGVTSASRRGLALRE